MLEAYGTLPQPPNMQALFSSLSTQAEGSHARREECSLLLPDFEPL